MSDYTKFDLNDMPYWERQHNNPADDSPVVITMHYMTGTAVAMSFLLDGIDFPLREIALQGTHPSGYPEEGGYSWFERERDFYDVLSEAEQESLIRKEVNKIAAFIKALREKYSGKFVVTGMSQGGDLSLHLAAYYPDLIDLAVPMAGRLSELMQPDAIESDNLPKVVILQGADDLIVTVDDAKVAESYLKAQDYEVSLDVYEGVGHDISEDMVEKLRTVIKSV